MTDLKMVTIVKGNRAFFRRYRQDHFYYGIMLGAEENHDLYEFPIPREDIGDATLENSEKAVMLMRYIRRALLQGTFTRVKG